MLFNKNMYRKADDTKVLHKVGKQWKVISVALLLALAGAGATAMHSSASVNADTTNGNQQTSVASAGNYQSATQQSSGSSALSSGVTSATSNEVKSLTAAPSVATQNNNAQSASNGSAPNDKPVSANQPRVRPSSSAKINYTNNDAGSAASYRANAESDRSVYNAKFAQVNSYVNSLNNAYNPQVNSYKGAIQSDSVQASNDQSAATSYSAIAGQSNYSAGLSARASSAGLTVSAYIEGVGVNYHLKSDTSSYEATFASKMNTVNSYAQTINNIDNNGAVSDAYQIAAASADANANLVKAQLSAAVSILRAKENENGNVTSNNVNFYQMSAADEIALNNSAADANYVNSLAHSLGYSNSFATSSAVMSYARDFNNAVAKSDVDFNNASNSSISMNVSSASLRQVLSDTAAMIHWGGISKKDYVDVNSAQNVVNQLTSDYNSASASASDADVLGNMPTMDNLFGTKGRASVLKDVNSYADVRGALTGMNASAINSATNSANQAAASASNDVSDYLNSAGVIYALAPSLAADKANDVRNDETALNAENTGLKDFYSDHANIGISNDFNQMKSAGVKLANDGALSNAFGQHVYNYAPKDITMISNGLLHSKTDYGSTGDTILGKFHRGDRFSVNGVGIARNGYLRYLVDINGVQGYVTASQNYAKQAYLPADNGNVTVQTTQSCFEYNSSNFNENTRVDEIPAGSTLSGKVISMDSVYGGFTRMQLDNGNWITANTDWVQSLNPAPSKSGQGFKRINYWN